MWTCPINYNGALKNYGNYSGSDIKDFLLGMERVTLAWAGIEVYEKSRQLHQAERRLISGKEAYQFLACYFKESWLLGIWDDFDRMQFIGQVWEKNGLKRIEAVSRKANFPGTYVDNAGILVTEQPLLKERLIRDLGSLVHAILEIKP